MVFQNRHFPLPARPIPVQNKPKLAQYLWLQIPPLRAAFAARRVERAPRAAQNSVVAEAVPERGAVGIQNLLLGERREALESVGIFANIVPGEDAAVGDGVVGDERVQVEVREA